jgi:SAM-dependent methyltransferase
LEIKNLKIEMIFWLYLILFIVLFSAAYGAISAAPWIPTRRGDVKRMIDLAGVKKGDVVYDLGCGDGRLVFAAARLGAKATGVEIFILAYLFAKIKSFFIPHSRILFGDLFKKDISGADVVFIFLLDKSYGRLLAKFNRELKPGARVVVGCWPIKEWPAEITDKPNKNLLTMYLYKIGR